MLPGQPPLSFRPLVVLRRSTRWPSREAAVQSAQYREQNLTIGLWASDRIQTLLSPLIIFRFQRQYRAGEDRALVEAIETAKVNRTVLLIDDFMRLIDCRSDRLVREGVTGLLKLEPPIYSLADGLLLPAIRLERLQARIYAGRIAWLERSRRAREAYAQDEATDKGPTKRAAIAGARARKAIADRRAVILQAEIEKVRETLPADRQNNLAALAEALNEAGVPTRSGKGQWQGSMVGRVLERIRARPRPGS